MKTASQIILGIILSVGLANVSPVKAQTTTFEDPYGDSISSVNDIDIEIFWDVIEEILYEIEDNEFEGVYGDEIIDGSSFPGIKTYKNYIDMPGQFENRFVHNEKAGEIRLIYSFGPSTNLSEETASKWYTGLVERFNEGNEKREWGLHKKDEENVAGLPHRTTFFEFEEDDYASNHVEIYYTNSSKKEANSKVTIIFILTGY